MRRLFYFVTFLFIFLSGNLTAQTPAYRWAKSAGSSSNDFSESIAVNGSGNSYVTGYFTSPTITFGSTTLTNAGGLGYDMYIVKYNANGNILWARSSGGLGNEEGKAVTVDDLGNCYVTGYFSSATVTFGSATLTHIGYTDIFIVKYDSSGNVVWAKGEGGSDYDVPEGIAVDVSGNIYITGEFQSPTITFGSTTLTRVGGYDTFTVKYDVSGNVVWAKGAGGSNPDYSSKITVDASGNSYVAGFFNSSSITFGSTTLTNSGSYDMYIVKYDVDGNVAWAKSAGGTDYDDAKSIAIDASGNSYVTGSFLSSTITFGSTTLSNIGGGDMYIVKYDSMGIVAWAKNSGGTGSDNGISNATDGLGNCYVTGDFRSSSITFGAITVTNNGTSNIFIVKYDINGNVLWAMGAGGTSEDGDYSYGIAADMSGNIFGTGIFQSSNINFGSTTLTNNGGFDIYIVKINDTDSLIAPSVGDEWLVGSQHNILWHADNLVGQLNLDYSTNNGTSWQSIAMNIPVSNQSYSWTVPMIPAPNRNMKVRLTNVSDTTNRIVSNTFSVIKDSLERGIVAYYPFNGDANDSSGNGHNGIVYGAVQSTDRFGDPSGAYHFNGVDNNYVKIPYSPSFDLRSNYTLSTWVYSEGCDTVCSVPGYVSIIAKRNPNPDNFPWDLAICYLNQHFKKLYLGRHLNTSQPNGESTPYSDGTITNYYWQQLAVTVKNDSVKFWINGILAGSSVFTIPSFENSADLMIGWDGYGIYDQVHGSIDDIRIYNRALSEAEILGLYHEHGWPVVSNSISGKVFLDLNRNRIKDNNENLLSGWQIKLSGSRSDSTLTDSTGSYKFISLLPGSYSISATLQSHSIQTAPQTGNYTISLTPGTDTSGLDFGIYRDTTRYRTFSQSDYTQRAVKLRASRGHIPMPTVGNVLDTTATYQGWRSQGLTLGIPRPDSSRYYGWIVIRRSNDFSFLYRILPLTGLARGFDFLNNNRLFVGRQLFLIERNQNNHLVGEHLALKINIAASDDGTTPQGLGNLIYNDPTQLNNPYNGMTVRAISNYVDTALTSWKRYTLIPNFYSMLDSCVSKINRAFLGVMDTASISPLRIKGTQTIESIPYLQLNPATIIQPRIANNFWNLDQPQQFLLHQNYPNPFNPTTIIDYDLPSAAYVRLKIYNIIGQQVMTFDDEIQEAGFKSVEWNANNFPSGVYFYRLEAVSVSDPGKSFTQVKKMLLVK